MRLLYTCAALALLQRTVSGASDAKDKPLKPCTIRSPTTGAFFDLTQLAIHRAEEGKKEEKTESWHARGYDYPANFTLNFCEPVVEQLEDVVGVDEASWRNVSAFYQLGGKTYSIGQQNSEPVFRGRKLVLNYTNGSPCGWRRPQALPLDSPEEIGLRALKDHDDDDRGHGKRPNDGKDKDKDGKGNDGKGDGKKPTKGGDKDEDDNGDEKEPKKGGKKHDDDDDDDGDEKEPKKGGDKHGDDGKEKEPGKGRKKPDDGDGEKEPPEDPPQDPPRRGGPNRGYGRRKSTIISLLCDMDSKGAVSFVGTSDECTYFFEARSAAACPGIQVEKQQLGPGGVFGVIALVAFLVYIVGGCVYQRMVKHQRGWQQLPNYSLWAAIVNFFKDIFIIMTSSCSRCLPRRRGYSRISTNGNARGRESRQDENRLIDQLDEEWDE